jgi:hypothetical protein
MTAATKSAHAPATDEMPIATALVVLADGSVLKGRGLGAEAKAVGEICFNTSMTGYQEIMTDPSYAGQIINFTFPHIGNVGANPEDVETQMVAARGCILNLDITEPSKPTICRPLPASIHAPLLGASEISAPPTASSFTRPMANSTSRLWSPKPKPGPALTAWISPRK